MSDVVKQKNESLGWFKLNCQNAITYTKGSAMWTMQEVFTRGRSYATRPTAPTHPAGS